MGFEYVAAYPEDDYAIPPSSTTNTVVPRYIAAFFDNLLAMLICVVAAKFVGEHLPYMHVPVAVFVYLAYYFVFEILISRTPGKLLTGLVVVSLDGESCTWHQVLTRTLFRLLEVNPLFFGAIPAALSIVLTEYHQRIGDRMAGTTVVHAVLRR